MNLRDIERAHRQDILIRWVTYITSLALASVVVGCAYHLTRLKQDAPQGGLDQASIASTTAPATTQQTPQDNVNQAGRNPSDVGRAEQAQMRSDLFKLQEENARLRAALIEAQQKLVGVSPTKRKPAPKIAVNRKPSRVPKVAEVRRVKKKPKVIQVSFDAPKDLKQQ